VRRRIGAQASDIVVMHPSTLKNWKRPMDVIASAGRALREDDRLRYVIVGDGPYRGAMEQASKEAGVEDRVCFLGQVGRHEMPALYRAADLVLLPSEVEGLAYTYLEAMASSCVLVTSDLPASREVVEHRRTGLLFPVGDVAKMTDLTLKLAGDSELRHRVSTAARARMDTWPTLDQSIDRFGTLIDSVVRGGGF
jgi:glycosyltransferase involved in cell wall biosynthesis